MFCLLDLIDSIAAELEVKLRDSKRNSGLRISNGSLSQDKRLSTPTQSAHLEDGPVLRPPPPSDKKHASAEQVGPV